MFQISTSAIPVAKTVQERKSAYRKTEKGRVSRVNERRAKADRDYLAKRFVAWDGEGVTRRKGAKQDYVLLMHSDGHPLTEVNTYLSTERIFSYIMAEKQDGVINVIYGASYDWNMWLRDLPRRHLEILRKTGKVKWMHWAIEMRIGKEFRLKNTLTGEKVRFFDVVSLFQSSFVVACEKNLKDRFYKADMIRENKMLRGDFKMKDLGIIAEYCNAELVNLVALMDDIRLNMFNAGMRVTRWDGPGAAAVALFQQHGIKEDKRETRPEEFDAVHTAYFGGRFEMLKAGYTDGTVYEYDVNSAYPRALLEVPVLAGGHWEEHDGDAYPKDTDFVLYNATFKGAHDHHEMPYPLPHRDEKGNISYPANATGWWWGPEINQTRRYIEQYPEASLTIHKTWVFRPVTTRKPFAFITQLYHQRKTFKAQGNGAEKAIKLGMNSMYGKLAQQIGWGIDRKGNLRLPPYHQMEWAGYVTSWCRARVYEAALQDLDSVIAFETDALFTTRPLKVREGNQLGDWEKIEFKTMAYLQSGTYFTRESGGTLVEKTRGVDRDQIHYADALKALETEQPIPATLKRFYALPLALAQNFDKWLTWETVQKNVQIQPQSKRIHMREAMHCHACRDGRTLRECLHSTFPKHVAEGSVSQPKAIAWLDDTYVAEEEDKYRQEDLELYASWD